MTTAIIIIIIMTGDFENHFSDLQKTQGMSFASEKTKE